MAPASIALKVLPGKMTAWDLAAEVCMLANRSSFSVRKLLMPLFAWALNACCKTNSGGRRMELSFSPITGRSRTDKRAMARRLEGTIGVKHADAREPEMPMPSHPAW